MDVATLAASIAVRKVRRGAPPWHAGKQDDRVLIAGSLLLEGWRWEVVADYPSSARRPKLKQGRNAHALMNAGSVILAVE